MNDKLIKTEQGGGCSRREACRGDDLGSLQISAKIHLQP